MKIVDVKVHLLQSPLSQPFAFSQGWVGRRSALVEIVTDEGLTGWGEAFAQGLEPPQIAAAAIEHALKPLVGANPLDIEVLWHRMYHATRDYGRKGSVVAAISAVDIALWDIAGKAYNRPDSSTPGRRFPLKVSVRHRLLRISAGRAAAPGRGGDPALRGRLSRDEGEARLRCARDDTLVMEEVRRALGTREVELMVDTNHGYGVAEALRSGACSRPTTCAGMKSRWRRRTTRISRAAAEAVHADRRRRERAYVVRFPRAAGPKLRGCRAADIGSVGGITACRHVVALAHAHGVQVNPHVWGSATQAASLQLIAAVPPPITTCSQQPIFSTTAPRTRSGST